MEVGWSGRGKRNQLSRRRVNFWQGCQDIGHEVATHSTYLIDGYAINMDQQLTMI